MPQIYKTRKSIIRCFDRHFLTKGIAVQLIILLGIYVALGTIFCVILYQRGVDVPVVRSWGLWVYTHMVDAGTVIESVSKDVNDPVVVIVGLCMNMLNILLFGGLFISVFTNFFEDSSKKVRKGEVRYKINDGHYVILGWDIVGASIVCNLMKNDKKCPIVILSEQQPDNIKKAIDIYANGQAMHIDENYLYVFNGAFTNINELSNDTVALQTAKKIYVLGEKNSVRMDSDSVYAAINNCVVEKKCTGVQLVANINNFSIFSKLKNIEYEDRSKVDVSLFNFYENWARRIWSHIPETAGEISYSPLAYKTVTENNFVHLIIIGFGNMGQALAVEAARIAHYGNENPTLITIIDANLHAKMDKFTTAFHLKQKNKTNSKHTEDIIGTIFSWDEDNGYTADVEFEFIDKSAESGAVRTYLGKTAENAVNGKQIPTLAITFSDLDTALDLTLSLPISFTVKECGIPILLRNENDRAADRFGLKKAKGTWGSVEFFGNLKECTDIDEKIEIFAKLLNAIYDVFEFHPDGVNPNELWNTTSEYNRWSSRHQALALVERLRSEGYELRHISACVQKVDTVLTKNDVPCWQELGEKVFGTSLMKLSKAEHDRWSTGMWLSGWHFADSRNDDLHRHNNIIDYAELDQDTKDKDTRPLALTKWILENYCGVSVVKK